jgi:hypothetical protein
MSKVIAGFVLATGLFLCAAGDLFAGAPPSRAPERGGVERERPDACPVCRFAERLGLRMQALAPIAIHRCADVIEAPVLAASPRGLVRAEDLDALVVEHGLDAPDVGVSHVEVRLGGEALLRIRDPVEWIQERIPLDAHARETLRGLRGCLEWGAFLADEPASRVRFWIEEPRPATRRLLARIDDAGTATPRWVRDLVRAQALLDAGYDCGAARLADAVLRPLPGEPHAAALAYAAYLHMGVAASVAGCDARDRVLRLRETRGGAPATPCALDAPGSWRQPAADLLVRGGCGG